MILTVVLLIWAAMGVFSYGAAWAYWDWKRKNEWPSLRLTPRDDAGIVVLVSVTGPVGLFVSLFATNFCQHGWKLGSLSGKS